MKKIILLLLLYCLQTVVYAQTPTRQPFLKKVRMPTNPNNFPQSFIGNWKGKLQWMVAGKATQTFTMQLRIQPTDSVNQYTWQIIYGDDAKDNRPYILKPVDTAKGHWVIDEKDGIILDSYVHGNCIHGAFTVQGSTIVDNYTIENGKMRVEYFTIKLDNKKQSGKGSVETPFVDSYLISSYQTGVLTRVSKL